jgi:hypothetical protein
METGVGQLHLRLDAGGPGHLPAFDTTQQVAKESRLADARFAAKDRYAAPPSDCVGHDLVEGLTLAAAPD